MSLYPQPTAFNPSYPPQGYAAPMAPPPYHHYPPQPPPQPVFYDPNIFRRDYMARLANLTVNSRPIIQSLSMTAQEYAQFAEVVVQCIDAHIRRVSPWMKLPSFYLLDAIAKNVYDPYARYFTPVVVRLFIDTYEVVDPNTRSKMEEMLLTWRTGSPNGRELFGVVPQVAIERHIWGGEGTHAASSGRNASASGSISTAQVLSELEFVLNQKERTLHANPYDKTTQSHLSILQQLRNLVQAGVSQEELSQILTQLRGLVASTPTVQPTPPPTSYAAQQAYHPPPPPTYVPPPAYSTQPPYQAPYGQYKHEASEPSIPSSIPAPAPVRGSGSTPLPVPDITNLYNSLAKAGMVPPTSTPPNAGGPAKPAESTPPVDTEHSASKAYRKSIMSQDIKLTGADITRHRDSVVDTLFKHLPVQCKHCGIRFADGSDGKKKYEDHLDMHFRQNHKASQAVGRGHSRSWFISLEDWVHGDAVDAKGKGRADGRFVSAKVVAAEEAARREAELRAMYVVVPPGDEAKSISCPICKETLKSEFLEDDEEWVWRNAVKKDDRIYHATCHAEAVASQSTLAVRLRNETLGRSRSRTPDLRVTPPKVLAPLNGEARKSETPTPSKLTGLKRKAEEDLRTMTSNSTDTAPQAKKLAT